jgi:hypothetical protein
LQRPVAHRLRGELTKGGKPGRGAATRTASVKNSP